jgi:hypothetical protein
MLNSTHDSQLNTHDSRLLLIRKFRKYTRFVEKKKQGLPLFQATSPAVPTHSVNWPGEKSSRQNLSAGLPEPWNNSVGFAVPDCLGQATYVPFYTLVFQHSGLPVDTISDHKG